MQHKIKLALRILIVTTAVLFVLYSAYAFLYLDKVDSWLDIISIFVGWTFWVALTVSICGLIIWGIILIWEWIWY
jgi:hypothetical protein